ncbi:DUF2505 family protein [Kineococcus sp. R8]|uniref:DUF2505 family protein n=1 Tax=Kineococcus siccus TaxID=2696567 RepID=UPI0014120BCD|nr:DUF2505 family protein [Kineococcus siccus]
MQIHEETQYGATPQELFAVMRDPEFARARATASGALEHDAEVQEVDGTTRVVSSRTISTGPMPETARRFVGSTVVVEQVERWSAPATDGSRNGTASLTVRGVPVTFEGTMTLRPTAGGCTHVLDGTLRAKVPLVGASIEKVLGPIVTSMVRSEAELARTWLARG